MCLSSGQRDASRNVCERCVLKRRGCPLSLCLHCFYLQHLEHQISGLFPHTHQFSRRQLGVPHVNSVLTYWLGGSVRFHSLRAPSHTTAPPQTPVPTCRLSWLTHWPLWLAVNWGFPWLPPQFRLFVRMTHRTQEISLLTAFGLL